MGKWNSVLIKMGLLTGKVRGDDVQFTTLREANNHEAQCCGVYCCDKGSALRMDDRVTGLIGEVYWENDVLMAKRPSGAIVTII